MKTLWCHDGPICKYKNDYYGTSLNNDVFKRYYYFTDELVVASRIRNIDNPNNFSKITLKGLRVLELPNCSNLKGIIFKSKIAKKKLRMEIKKSDIIVIRLPSILGFICLKLAKKYQKKYFIELVGDAFGGLWTYGTTTGKIMAPIEYIITKKYVRDAENVLYVSKFYLQKKYPNKKNNVGCADVLLDKPNKEILLKRIEKIYQKKEELILGLIGRLDVTYRGHDKAIIMLNELNKRDIKCKFIFLGKGDTKRIINIAKKYDVLDQIEFSGELPSGKAVFEWIDNIDILVMPTQQETLGRSIIEAMSRGCPVLGSYETAIPEQLGSDCVFYSFDVMKFVDKIEYMYRNANYMEYCANENFYRSFKYCNEETNKIRENFYDKVLKSSK